MFQPKILQPTPDPFWVREIKKIDPTLRVVWGYERYFKSAWAIERQLSPERYFTIYEDILTKGGPRFVKQPIYDSTQMQYDENGDEMGFPCIGERDFDLAPEYEFLCWADVLDARVVTDIKREYAWHVTHPSTRAKVEAELREAKEQEKKNQRVAAGLEAVEELVNRAKNTVMVTKPV
jgi:hypothetical protein